MLKSKEWEIQKSTLAKVSNKEVTYKECRRYACEDIINKLTKVSKLGQVFDIPKGKEFHFIGRIDTNIYSNEPDRYYKSFKDRSFVAFSIINNKNISRYRGGVFFAYDILPEEIVHIFPADSSTITDAKKEDELTRIPSLWLSLDELEDLTLNLGVYNQITCKTKRNGKIIKPSAVIAFGNASILPYQVAKKFNLPCIRVNPDEDAVEYTGDLLYDKKIYEVADNMQQLYDLDLRDILFLV